MRRALRFLLLALGVALAWFIGRPVLFLALVWWNDPAGPPPHGVAGQSDVSGLNQTTAAEIIAVPPDPAEAEKALAALVARAAREGRKIVISGAQHSMGGHTLYAGGLAVDMRPFNRMSLDAGRRLLTVGTGARWLEVIPFLDRQGLAVAVMQSNNDFTVGGSLSVNCHGWQHGCPPIAGTVESFRLLQADGQVVRCSRTQNAELFSLALGGYGLFGVILDVELHVVPNEFYRAEPHRVKPAGYAREYRRLVDSAPDTGMAYGRISVAPDSFLTDALIILLRRTESGRPATDTLRVEIPAALKRVIFRGSVGSDYGKNLRWWLETKIGETGSDALSRNQIMDDPSEWFANRDPAATEILHEYFVPCDRLAEFLENAKPVFARHHPDLLNITVREVRPDPDTYLRYATEPVLGLVMLYHYPRTAAADEAMAGFTRELINVALACGGTYYLPYRPHATPAQFERAYPQAGKFFALKRHYDPGELFQNEFYRNYGGPVR
ncbi:MAG TPA: FAD-binding oxidoreductase [Lacunisphaera sp.]|nr:FAD-binding oxidoreductase [Lacunisphaera sp.]